MHDRQQLILGVSDIPKLQFGDWPDLGMVLPIPESEHTPARRSTRCRCHAGTSCRGHAGTRGWRTTGTGGRCRAGTTCRRWRRCSFTTADSAQIIEYRILLLAVLALAVLAFAHLVVAVHDDDVRVVWQVLIRNMTGKVARNRTGHTLHHRTGRIDDWIA